MLSINFNCFNLGISGGIRVVLELANRSATLGNKVSITAIGSKKDLEWYNNPIRADLCFASASKTSWPLRLLPWGHSSLDMQAQLLSGVIPDSDINVATFCFTAEPTVKNGKGKLFHLVQGYEPWFFDNADLKAKAEASYNLPLTKLCVSRWLQEKVGGEYIGNGTNTEISHPSNSFEDKEPNSILHLHRGFLSKGSNLAMETLQHIYNLNPKVKIHIVANKNARIAAGFPHLLHVDLLDTELAELYSKVRVLLYTSSFEGFGLPPLEAFASGTNVVSTNFLGNEYLVDDYNCYLANDFRKLAFQAQKLLSDDNVSLRQIGNAAKTVQKHDLNLVTDRMLKAFSR
jgi:glycosyltransferase involved in cell wall biosynthesis